MKKNVVQDVVPPKKSIRNVEIASKPRAIEENKDVFSRPVSLNKQMPMEIKPNSPSRFVPPPITPPPPTSPPKPPTPPPPQIPTYKYEYNEPKKKSRKWLYIASCAFLLIVAFAVSALFRSAEIRITPKQQVATLDGVFTAKKDATGNDLGFQVVTVTKDTEKLVDSTGITTVQNVEKKAQGRIVIYNNFNSSPQKLVATTRFETPEGIIFRLVSPVTVPGQQITGGKTIAGSVEVTVEADKSGASYNIGLKDFTIPGLKGDPKYTKIYGRSKTEMTGGFSGQQKILPKETVASADSELEASLQTSLSKDVTSQIPADFVLFQNSLSYRFEPITQETDSSGGVLLKKKGTLTAVIFNRTTLTQIIMAKIALDSGGNTVKTTNLDSLDFAYQTATSSIGTSLSVVNFTLKGQPNFVWILDENKLKSDLLGLSKSNAKTVIGTYGTIKEAWVTTRPFWNGTIPNNPSKVTVVNTLTAGTN